MSNQQNDWKEGTIDALQHMFEDKVDKDMIKQLFEENEHDIERTVDAILRKISASRLNDTVSDVEDEFEMLDDADTNEQVADSQNSISDANINTYNSCVESITREVEQPTSIVELNISEVSAPHFSDSVNSAATYTISHSEIEGSTSISLEEQVELLRAQLAEATLLKMKADEEKKNGMKWCLNEMEKLKEEIQIKDTTIAQKELEISQLKKKIEEKAAKDGNKIDKFIHESKQMLQEGVESLSKQLNESVNKVQSEFKKLDDKDWVIVDRLKEFATEFKREIMELFKDPIHKKASEKTTKQIQDKKPTQEEISVEEQRQLWAAEKASLESYNTELENRMKFMEQEKKLQESSQEPAQEQQNPAPTNVIPLQMPPMPGVRNLFYPPQYYYAQNYSYNPHN